MKRLVSALVFTSSIAIVSQRAVSQSATNASNPQDIKHLLTTMPEDKGRIQLAAMSIDRDWAPSIIHLKGNARVEIWTTPKNAREITVLRADEIDYNEGTGEITPRGNVRVTVEDAK